MMSFIFGYVFGVVSITVFAFWKKRKLDEAKAKAEQSRPEETEYTNKKKKGDFQWLNRS